MVSKYQGKEAAGDYEAKKEMILKKLRQNGYRITRQRRELLDVILENECSSCKEIYYKASKQDPNIGTATVYRMINTLEEIGAIDRKNMYKVNEPEGKEACIVELDDHTVHYLSSQKWNLVLQTGLRAWGYLTDQNISSVTIRCSHGKVEEKK